MNKIAVYILLILIFLGISKSFAPTGKSSIYLKNVRTLGELYHEMPVSIVLLDAYDSGLIIKSHFHKYKIVRVFNPSEIITTRVSKKYYYQNYDNVGLSLFRRDERGIEDYLPSPPGTLFVGQLGYGSWRNHASGQKRWHFHRAYRHLKREFYWGSYHPSYEFFSKYLLHKKTDQPYYGPDNEFGTKGKVTQELLDIHSESRLKFSYSIKDYIVKLFTKNPFRSN